MSKARDWGLPAWYVAAYRTLVIAVLSLIVLGGSVRVMNAGLACPDWPLCFGQIFPDFHPLVYFEFIHRAWAGLIMLSTIALHVILFRSSKVSRNIKWIAFASLVLVFTQAVMGGLTVLLKLKAGVVATHLAMGTGFFAMLVWIYQTLVFDKATAAVALPKYVWRQCLFLLSAVYLQIILGGLVASNYAANVCPGEFPTCHGEMFPTFSGAIGLQVLHRTWAYMVFIISALTFYMVRKYSVDRVLRKLVAMIFAIVIFQVCVGISNVLFYTPPLIAILHLLIATKILWVSVRLVHRAGHA